MSTYQTGPFAQPRRIPNASQNPSSSPRNSRYVHEDIAPDEMGPDDYAQRAYTPLSFTGRPPLETANSQRSQRSEPPRQPYSLNQANLRAAEDQFERSPPDNLHPDHALSWGPYAEAQQQRRLSADQIPPQNRPRLQTGWSEQNWGRRSSVDAGTRRGPPPGGPQHIAWAAGSPQGSEYGDGYAAGFNAGRRSSQTRAREGRERRGSHSSRDERHSVHDDEGYDSYDERRRARRSSYSGQSRRDREREDRRRKQRSSDADRRPTLSDSVEHALINLKNAFTGGR